MGEFQYGLALFARGTKSIVAAVAPLNSSIDSTDGLSVREYTPPSRVNLRFLHCNGIEKTLRFGGSIRSTPLDYCPKLMGASFILL